MILAATFFAGITIKANVAAEQSLEKQTSTVMTDMYCQVPLNMSNLPLVYRNITSVEGVESVDYISTFGGSIGLAAYNYSNNDWSQIVSFTNTSKINNEWTNNPVDGIPTNYTYVIAGSDLAKKVQIGDNLTTSITFPTPKYFNYSTVYVNLTVAGFATLTEKGYALVSGNPYYYPSQNSPYGTYRNNILIISWENTLYPLWNSTLESATLNMQFYINVDRQSLISPWNIPASVSKINVISDRIENQIRGYISYPNMNNILSNSLQGYQSNLSGFLVIFFVISIPIFFVAWYLGSTVSDVSFNIRRREIGLLSTKGLSSGQIQRMFLTEALVIGLLGGVLGVVGGLILNQYYAGQVNLNTLFSTNMYSPEVMIVTAVFGVILALASVFWSSRRAARIPAVDALRNDLTDDYRSHRRSIPVIALILGSYKLVTYLLGANIPSLFNQWLYQSGNIFLSVLQLPIVYFDALMTFIGPFLFLWGIATLLIRDSTRFQAAISKIGSFMGDLGALAAKNVRRNPVRLTAIAFVISLILCLAVSVTGQVASQQDYIQRTLNVQVGADINVNLGNASEGQIVLNQLLENVSAIQNATVERILQPRINNNYSPVTVKAIDPNTWQAAAYYEDGWFNGKSVDQIMKSMKADNNTIVLSRAYAKQYDLQLDDYVNVNFNSCPRSLKIIALFGPEPPDSNINQGGAYISTPGGGSQYIQINPVYGGGYNSPYDAYVPRDLFNATGADSDIYKLEQFTTNVLIKLKPGVNGTEVAQQIRGMDIDVSSVTSLAEEQQSSNQQTNSATYSSLQSLDIQSFGIVFAVISASVGTCLIALVSLKERSREATLMSVRGLSYRQLVWVFLVESMAIITFAVILGAIVGVIVAYGSISTTNSAGLLTLVTQRLVYPPNAILTIATYAGLIYASTIGAIIVMSSQYVTKLEKMVRTR